MDNERQKAAEADKRWLEVIPEAGSDTSWAVEEARLEIQLMQQRAAESARLNQCLEGMGAPTRERGRSGSPFSPGSPEVDGR